MKIDVDKEVYIWLAKSVFGFVAIVGFIMALSWGSGAYDCWQKLSDSGKDYRYKLLKGCQYQSKDGWLNYDRLRDIAS